MPIYEYVCQSCGHQLEAMQKFSDAPLTDCPTCHKPALNKIVSSTSFQLKGTGWYVTDIRDKNKPKPASDATPTSSSDTSSKDTKAD
jgi:putative FmdB family regulatory protein